MSTPPKLPGLSDYPELEKRFAAQYTRARLSSSCPRCEVSKVVQRFRLYVEQRQRRDKHTRR